jgi:hypothetical protein
MLITERNELLANMWDADKSTSPQRAAAALARRWECAWNRHDMLSAGELLAIDADFVNVGGCWSHGRGHFLDHHVRLHERQMRSSTWSNLALTVWALSVDVALAHLEWRIEGDRDRDGLGREPRCGVFTWVLGTDGDSALIAAAHDTNVVCRPPPGRAPRLKKELRCRSREDRCCFRPLWWLAQLVSSATPLPQIFPPDRSD